MAYKNKEDQKAAARRHYLKNKEKMKARAKAFTKEAVKRNITYTREILKKTQCIDCGFSNWMALEFDHLVPETKLKNVSDLVRNGASIKKIQDEIDKCEVRCANCHRIKTHKTIWNTKE